MQKKMHTQTPIKFHQKISPPSKLMGLVDNIHIYAFTHTTNEISYTCKYILITSLNENQQTLLGMNTASTFCDRLLVAAKAKSALREALIS